MEFRLLSLYVALACDVRDIKRRRPTCDIQQSVERDIVDNEWRGEYVSNSTAVHTKMGHVSKTTPPLRVICHPFGQT